MYKLLCFRESFFYENNFAEVLIMAGYKVEICG